MISSAATTLPPLSIEKVYRAIHGSSLKGEGAERRGYCLSTQHKDSSPSCDYNVEKNTFHCKVCEEGGSTLSLIIVAGKADNSKAALKWLSSEGLIDKIAAPSIWSNVSVIYQYVNADGALLYEVGRWENPKKFSQRAPLAKGGYNETNGALKGVERVPYYLPELLKAAKERPLEPVYVVEGEKDARNLRDIGVASTTNAQGAKFAWPVGWKDYFVGLDTVYVLADNDEAGRKAALQRAQIIALTVPNVLITYALPGVGEKGDVSDWLEINGADKAALRAICAEGERAEPYRPTYDSAAVESILEDQSDMGSAQWFNHHYREVARFVMEAEDWYVFKDGIWEKNAYVASNFCDLAVNGMLDAANDSGDIDFINYAKGLRKLSARKNMMESATHTNIARITDFDKKPWLLNCANGTFDLRTHQLRPFDISDLLTLRTPVAYDEEAKCPSFERWLRTCVQDDEELFSYMQQVMGTCLEGRPGLRSFYFIFGPKGTGKSTFIRILEALLGPYQAATDFNALTEGRFGSEGGAPSPHLARLKGRRMVSASEARGNSKLDAARIKQLIGGDRITARLLGENLFEFQFEATLIMSGNEMPRIVGDESIWSKFKPVPFVNQIGEEDPYFEERVLLPELSGILNFALKGLAAVQSLGYRIPEPKRVTRERDLEFSAQDTFKDFVRECLERLDPYRKHPHIPGSAVRDAYIAWAVKTNQPKLGAKALKAEMIRHKFDTVQFEGNLAWKNIRVKMVDGGRPGF